MRDAHPHPRDRNPAPPDRRSGSHAVAAAAAAQSLSYAATASIRQRWLAAERLAAGDPDVLAAAAANLPEEAIDQLKADPAFGRLLDACRTVHDLPRAEWLARAERLMRGSAERAVAEGRVSTMNLVLRATCALEAGWVGEEGEEDGLPPLPEDSPLADLPPDFLRRLTRRNLIEYLLMGEPGPDEADGSAPFIDELAERFFPHRRRRRVKAELEEEPRPATDGPAAVEPASSAPSAAPSRRAPAPAAAPVVADSLPPARGGLEEPAAPPPPPFGRIPESHEEPVNAGPSVWRLGVSRAALAAAAGGPDPWPFPHEEPSPAALAAASRPSPHPEQRDTESDVLRRLRPAREPVPAWGWLGGQVKPCRARPP